MAGLLKSLSTQNNPASSSVTDFSGQSEVVPLSIISNSMLLREGLLLLLPPCLEAKFVGSYTGVFLPEDTAYHNPAGHVVLLDSNLGLEGTFGWIRYWKNLVIPAQVILLEVSNDPALITDYIEAGANGYSLQGATAVEVAHTIRATRQGQAHCSPEMTAYLFARLAARPVMPRPEVPLTTREQEVLRYIAANYSNQEIAEALVIEVLTVKHHVHNILAKLKVARRQEAARVAREQGWLE